MRLCKGGCVTNSAARPSSAKGLTVQGVGVNPTRTGFIDIVKAMGGDLRLERATEKSGAIGPWIETDLSEIDPLNIKLETRVNDELRQSDTTASMAFPIARIIEYISTFTTLDPGDLIATGTPTGSGARTDPPKWLRAGDAIEVTVEGVGTLRNSVVMETSA